MWTRLHDVFYFAYTHLIQILPPVGSLNYLSVSAWLTFNVDTGRNSVLAECLNLKMLGLKNMCQTVWGYLESLINIQQLFVIVFQYPIRALPDLAKSPKCLHSGAFFLFIQVIQVIQFIIYCFLFYPYYWCQTLVQNHAVFASQIKRFIPVSETRIRCLLCISIHITLVSVRTMMHDLYVDCRCDCKVSGPTRCQKRKKIE